MTDSRDEPEDAPPRVSGKKKRGRNDGTVIDNGSRIRGKVLRCRRERVVLVYRIEKDRERRTEKDDRRKEVGLAPVCRLLSGNTYGDQRGGKEEEEEEEEEERSATGRKGRKLHSAGRGREDVGTKGTRIDSDRERRAEAGRCWTRSARYILAEG